MLTYANRCQIFTFLYTIMLKFVDFAPEMVVLRTFNQIILTGEGFRCSFVAETHKKCE